jgi:beta-glucosidase
MIGCLNKLKKSSKWKYSNTATFKLFSFGYSQKKAIKKEEIKPKTEFVAELIRMTVDEKIGQLNLPTSGDITTGAANSSDG